MFHSDNTLIYLKKETKLRHYVTFFKTRSSFMDVLQTGYGKEAKKWLKKKNQSNKMEKEKQ